MAGAAFNRGASRQDYATPPEFIDAVEKRFGSMHYDLAASARNAKAPAFFTEEQDSLSQDWTSLVGRLWLNPPFAKIEPWARKCAASYRPHNRIFLLTPASIGAEWYATHVIPHARIYALVGRLCFDGKNPFPKDCTLALFGAGRGLEIWRWRQ